ncbi:MAG: DUF4230 domain-containing protein [Bacteroidales bacterium]
MTLIILMPFSKMYRIVAISFILLLIVVAGCKQPKRHFVISKIKSTAKLATTETIIDKVVIGQKEKRIFGLMKVSDAEFVAYTQAIIKTGIDLTKIEKDDVKIDGYIIELELPPVEVLDFAYPFEKFRIDSLLSDNDLFNSIDVIDQENFFRQAEIDIRKHLKYMGITEQTQENTRKIMEGLLKNLGYKEIYISFKDTTQLIPQVIIDKIAE